MRSRLKSSNIKNKFFQALFYIVSTSIRYNIILFLIVVTCADPSTFANAQKNPEKYDLIRVRTGGWNEFYIHIYFIRFSKKKGFSKPITI